MLYYENTPARQESCTCYATNSTFFAIKFHYQYNPSLRHEDALHSKLDRILFLLEKDEMGETECLEGTMSTREAADFIAISTRTFERKLKEGLIHPIAKNMKRNKFLKRDVVAFYIQYRGYKPTRMP